jgi:hypothetical protein
VTSPVRRRRARTHAVPPWRPGSRPALLGWLYCPRPHFPKPRTVPRPPRSCPPPRAAHRPAGRAPNRPSVSSAPPLPCTPAEAGACTQRRHRRSFGRRQAHLSPIKGSLPSSSRAEPRHAPVRRAPHLPGQRSASFSPPSQ